MHVRFHFWELLAGRQFHVVKQLPVSGKLHDVGSLLAILSSEQKGRKSADLHVVDQLPPGGQLHIVEQLPRRGKLHEVRGFPEAGDELHLQRLRKAERDNCWPLHYRVERVKRACRYVCTTLFTFHMFYPFWSFHGYPKT